MQKEMFDLCAQFFAFKKEMILYMHMNIKKLSVKVIRPLGSVRISSLENFALYNAK